MSGRLSIAALIGTQRIYALDNLYYGDNGNPSIRLWEAVTHAIDSGSYEDFVERLNRLACREEEIIVLWPDGSGFSFFWQCIPLHMHKEFLANSPKGQYLISSQSKPFYHGGFIHSSHEGKSTWSVHT